MTSYLLRHAIAVLRGTEEYPGDDRPLTPEGVAKMEKNAAGMLGLGLEFDAVIHSPLSRARDTARVVRKVMKPACRVLSSDADGPVPGAGRLIWMLTPRQLRMIGEAR